MSAKDIPYDLDEILEEDEIMRGTFSDEFDNAMFMHGFFERGFSRRSHRIITEKAKKLSVNKVRAVLLNTTVDEIEKQDNKELREYEIKQMFEIAEKYGFEVI